MHVHPTVVQLKSRTFSFNNCLYLCSSVEFILNRKMTIQSHYQCKLVSGGVPGLFMPKTFRSQERIVPMGNFCSRDFLFPGTFVPWERKFPGTFVPGERKFLGTFVPWTFRSEELSFPGERKFPGTKGPGNERSRERKFLELSFLGNESSP